MSMAAIQQMIDVHELTVKAFRAAVERFRHDIEAMPPDVLVNVIPEDYCVKNCPVRTLRQSAKLLNP